MERELARADALMAELEETCGFVCREFEYGPGLPVDYFDAPDPAAERAFLEQLGDKLDAMAFQGPLTLEIGRGLTACCGTYLTTVVDAKTNQKVNYAIVDGGIHHLTYYGGAMAMKQPPVRFLEETDGNGKRCEAVSPAAAIDDAEASAESWTICGVALHHQRHPREVAAGARYASGPRARLRACRRLLHDRGRVAAAVP